MAPRLSALDSSFLDMEDGGAHMHVAAVLTFAGPAPRYDELVATIEARLPLVPRYRQRLAFVPLGQGRPRWVDDPRFDPRHHIRHAALPSPGTEQELQRLTARILSQRLDRDRALWELWLVEGLTGDRFALISKTHHALIDGVAGVDLAALMLDRTPEPPPPATPPTAAGWAPRPVPSAPELLAEALLERTAVPRDMLRSLRTLARDPRSTAQRLADGAAGVGAVALAGLSRAPRSTLNVEIGAHRRCAWVDADLDAIKAIKSSLGGTVNEAVLAAVTLALGRWMRGRGEPTADVTLKALVPVSVRTPDEQGALGNRVTFVRAPLPVGVRDPIDCFDTIHAALAGLRESGEAAGAETLSSLAEYAPPAVMLHAARLQVRRRLFNLVVTNVPGPPDELYLLGRPLRTVYPIVPLARRQALGIAALSYHGRLGFGLLGDFDAVPDLDALATDLQGAIEELLRAVAPRFSRAPSPSPATT